YKENKDYNIEKRGTPIRQVSFIDSPGHEMLMATTLSGATLIDAAILVIAANEGIKPQTREHLMTLQAKKVEQLVVVQNKIDLVDKQKAKANHNEIKKFLGEKYSSAEIIPVSAQQGVNIGEILRAITEFKIPERKINAEPIFMIARSFDINKPGTPPKNLKGAVLGGALKQGILKVGDEIEIRPGRIIGESGEKKTVPINTKILGLFKGSKSVTELTPGGSMAVETSLDMALGKGDLLSGNILSHVDKLPENSQRVRIKYTLFPEVFGTSTQIKVERIEKKELLMLSINTSITGGTIGEINEKEATIDLKVPTIIFRGDNIGIARKVQGHWRLIGFGEVI
ncbi:MAG: translation initiation factor IF-2 subunit gamma, partial [Nanoarchaeota archaeon]|nr:translation initiation factor IF-2 subunit gamma [Nanoarchaeota archaeon]